MKFTGERFIPNNKDSQLALEHFHRYYALKNVVENKVVLDAASGEGYGSYFMSKYAKKVFAVDISKEAIKHAKTIYRSKNLKFINSSIENIPLEDNTIDIVVSFETIEHVDQDVQKLFMKEIKRVLKKDGILIISTPNKEKYNKFDRENEYHIKEFDKEEFYGFIKKYFVHIDFYDQGFHIISLLKNNLQNTTSLKNIDIKNKDDDFGKYVIAICGNRAVNINIDSVITNTNISYDKLISRVINLQNEVEERNNHIKKIDNLIIKKDKELQQIYSSNCWKILRKCYNIRDKCLPKNTKRRLFLKLIIRALKQPINTMRYINKENLVKLYNYFFNNEAGMLELKIDKYLSKEESIRKLDIIKYNSKDLENKLVFLKHENPLVTIIIPVFNQWEYTYSCLKAIYNNTYDIPYEIIIADDVSTDRTKNIDKYVSNVRVLRNDGNKGFLMNCKNAVKYAKGKYIHFLNNDTNVQEGWLRSLVELIESENNIGMVGSKLVYPDGKLQEAGGIIWDDASGWNYGRLDDPEKSQYNYVKEVDYISGASILIKKDLWDKIGGFDERFKPAYYEDADLAFQVRKSGYKVLYHPKSVVVHFEGITNGTDITAGVKKYQANNRQKFLDKWSDELKRNHFRNANNVFYARDRSRYKKAILVIDHYVPHYDKDAGGRCTFQYLKMFADLGLNVIFLGDNFYKHEPYTSILQNYGVEVLYGNLFFNNVKKWLEGNGKYFDYIYFNRPHITGKYIDILKENTNAKLIYFPHDLHYLREMRNYEIEKDKKILKSAQEWKKKEFEIFQKVDVIHVVSSYEKEILDKEFPDKPVRNIPLYIYDNEESKSKIIKAFDDRRDIMFVGGFGHSPNLDAILWFVKKIFPKVLEGVPDMKFYIIGSNPPEQIKELESENVVITGFVSDDELEEYYHNCRLVVVPLRFGAGLKGKVIEAMYYQTPIITTSIGAEGLIDAEGILKIEDEAAGFAWAVVEYYKNTELLKKVTEKYAKYIAKYFSEERAREVIEKDLVRGLLYE